MKQHCGKCHDCGGSLYAVLDGEEWCPECQVYHRYASHGWASTYGEITPCIPSPKDKEASNESHRRQITR